MGGLYGPKYCGQALLIVVGVFCCSFLCTGAAVLSPSVKRSFAVAASGKTPVASLLPPLSTDDAAAISAVATSVEWGFRPQSPSHSQHSQSSEVRGPERLQQQLLLQIVGLLPAVGRSKPGGSWEPTKWYGRPLPRRRRGSLQPFAVRLVQPNIYGVYKYLIESRQVELKQSEKVLKDGRTALVYELRPVSVWRRFFNNLT